MHDGGGNCGKRAVLIPVHRQLGPEPVTSHTQGIYTTNRLTDLKIEREVSIRKESFQRQQIAGSELVLDRTCS